MEKKKVVNIVLKNKKYQEQLVAQKKSNMLIYASLIFLAAFSLHEVKATKHNALNPKTIFFMIINLNFWFVKITII